MRQRLLTITEAARLLRRHPTAIHRMVRSGELGGVVRRGGGWVTAASIEKLLGVPLHLVEEPSGVQTGNPRSAEEADPTTPRKLRDER
jgi:hypothetical protein